MALFPKRVDLDQASIQELAGLYMATAQQLRGIVFQIGSKTVTVSSVNVARQLIQQRIDELSAHIGTWAAFQIQDAYSTGQSDAIAQLQSFEDSRTTAVASAIIAGSVVLDQLHREAAQALASELQSRLNDAVTQMGRSTDLTLGKMLRDSIQSRIASVDDTTSAKSLRKSILQAFDEQGVNALVDRAGKRWPPDVYAEMVSKTVLTQARNTGLTNSLSGVDYDLVQVSSHGALDDCKDWEGSILSLSGNTPGFFTVDDASAGGLFHPNCTHSLSPADPTDFPDGALPDVEA